MFIILFVCVLLKCCDAVIYRLTDSEYARMPPLMHMDSYETCQLDADALYCMSEYALVSDKPSSLLDMIQEFSAHQITNYNHSKLHYGICVTQTCQKFYDNDPSDLRLTLEACLNDSISEKYDLKVRLLGNTHCKTPGKSAKNIDQLDIIVGTICIVIVFANIVGSVFDYYCDKKKKEEGALRFLICFSLLHNWKKLMSSADTSTDPRLECLTSLHGIRVISTCLVIIMHSQFPISITPNPQFLEEIYRIRPLHIFLNGTLIMQTFLITSSFLLVYNLLLHFEKRQISWSILLKSIISRWLRLTPAYAIILALTATWFAHATSGPLWSKYVETEMNDCRLYWWQHILYINNYFRGSTCMGHSWYLAADTQLYCLFVIIFLACRTSRSRTITLSLLFIAGMIIPAAHVYFQDQDAIQIISPEAILNIFVTDPHFKNIYSPGHTNIIGYVIGTTMAYLVYHWQKQKVDIKKYQKPIYRILYWSLFIVAVYCCYIGIIFYNDGPRHPLYVRVLFAGFIKAVFGILVAALILGYLFKFEDLYRGVLEWHGWKTPSRLSYSAYLVHISLVMTQLGMQTSLRKTEIMYGVETSVKILAGTFIAALFFWLLVEAPFSNVMKQCLTRPKTEAKMENNEKEENSTVETSKL